MRKSTKAVLLTDEAIRDVELPKSGQTYLYDSSVKGFFVCFSKTARSFFVERHIHGPLGRKKIKIKIGPCDLWSAERARKRAFEIAKDIRDGLDPRDGLRRAVAGDPVPNDKLLGFRVVAMFADGSECNVASANADALPLSVAILDQRFALQIEQIDTARGAHPESPF